MKLLLAEDDAVFRKLLVSFLRKCGYDVVIAEDGLEAWRELQGADAPRIAVLDWMMPGLDGVEICRRLRAIPDRDCYTYVLLLTSRSSRADLLTGLGAGADGYLTKPFDPQELEARLRAGRRIVEAEAGLRSALEWRRAIFAASRDAIFISRAEDGSIVDTNAAAEELTGRKASELSRMRLNDLCSAHPCFSPDQAPGSCFEEEICRKDGARLLVEVFQHTVNIDGAAYIQTVARDVSERRRAAEAVLRSEANLRSFVEHAPHGIFESTIDGSFIAANPALVQMLGYESKAELLSMDVAASLFQSPEQRTTLLNLLMQNGGFRGVEAVWKRKDGKLVTVRLGGRVVRDHAGKPNHFEIMAEDVTQQRQLEEQLRQAQKLEAVGCLVGGIAHDFNNLVMIINGYSETVLNSLSSRDLLRDPLEKIQKAGDRAASLIRQLLAFSRKQVLLPRILNLNTTLSDTANMLQRLIGENIELRTRTSSELWSVKADAGQIEQALLNLAVNARDAMPDGGLLTLETANVVLDRDFERANLGARAGEYVMLRVTDTGCGMKPEILSHIFDPFFTTMEKGKGTGLGLSSVYGVVKQSGGYITVESEPGRGTTFAIFLPRVRETELQPEHSPRSERVGPASETILVVEDEEAAREVLCDYLEWHGYKVFRAGSGTEGLEICRKQPAIDLIISDVIMSGGMSGTEMAAQIRKRDPQMKLLFVSGYSDDALLHHGVFDSGVAFLQKPFKMTDLLKQLRRIQDGQVPKSVIMNTACITGIQ
jgi:PAS domain S-box-containing protein